MARPKGSKNTSKALDQDLEEKMPKRAYNKRAIKASGFEGYEAVEDSIFKFGALGDYIEGTLISKEEGRNFGNQVYKIRTPEDETKIIFGTTVLDSIMKGVPVGDTIIIQYTDEKENKHKGQNPIKIFKVFRKKSE